MNFREHDKLNREKYADFLLEIIKEPESFKRNSDSESFVIGIDSSWGSGKTTFLKMFQNKIEEEGSDDFIVINYDAWKSDMWQEPFETLAQTIFDNSIFNGQDDKENIKQIAVKIGGGLLKKFSSKVLPEEVIDMLKDIGKENIVEFINNYSKHNNFFEEYKKYKKNIIEMKETLKKIIKSRKMIIIIDELDRCRPDFAIKLLEIVKHLFDIENVIFIFALDMSQLSHSVGAIYGQGIDSEGYLSRFFDYITRLPRFTTEQYISGLVSEKSIINDNVRYSNDTQNIKFINCFSKLARTFNLSLRDINTIYNNFLILERLELSETIELEVYEIYLLFLILKYKNIAAFKKIFDLSNTENILELIFANIDKKIFRKESILKSLDYINKYKSNKLKEIPLSDYIGRVVKIDQSESIIFHQGIDNHGSVDLYNGVALYNRGNISMNLSSYFNNLVLLNDMKKWEQIKDMYLLQYIHEKLEVFNFVNSEEQTQ